MVLIGNNLLQESCEKECQKCGYNFIELSINKCGKDQCANVKNLYGCVWK